MQVAILAGGLGTRLRPVTNGVPKSLIEIEGRTFLEYQLDFLKKSGVTNVVLCVGYLGEQIERYFGDGRKFGVSFKYSYEKEQLLGTGGALRQAQNLLDNYFFVINGDTYLPLDYKQVEETFLQREKKAIMTVYDNRQDTGVSNNVELDADLMVIRHDKGKLDSKLRYVEAGVLVFKREVLDIIPVGRSISLEEGLYPTLIQQQEMAAYITDHRFYDIGSPEQLKAFAELLERRQR